MDLSIQLSNILDKSDKKLIATWTNCDFSKPERCPYYWIEELAESDFRINIILWEDSISFITHDKYGSPLVHSIDIKKRDSFEYGKFKYIGYLKEEAIHISVVNGSITIKYVELFDKHKEILVSC